MIRKTMSELIAQVRLSQQEQAALGTQNELIAGFPLTYLPRLGQMLSPVERDATLVTCFASPRKAILLTHAQSLFGKNSPSLLRRPLSIYESSKEAPQIKSQ